MIAHPIDSENLFPFVLKWKFLTKDPPIPCWLGNTECLESANNGPHPTAKVYDAAGICIMPLMPLSHKRLDLTSMRLTLYEKGIT